MSGLTQGRDETFGEGVTGEHVTSLSHLRGNLHVTRVVKYLVGVFVCRLTLAAAGLWFMLHGVGTSLSLPVCKD